MALDPRSGMPLREMMDRLFSDAFVMPRSRWLTSRREATPDGALTPPVNMYETDTDLMVIIPMPGVSPNDIQVDLLGTQLTVQVPVRRDEPHPDAGRQGGAAGAGDRQLRHRWYQHEFQIGPYHRVVELPYAVDAQGIQASYEHGLLSLRMPCPKAQVARRIPLQGAASS
ncbi:MAG TPA: Hsp20/alpha crystallin family protein [Chloroflexota bacterium]|nr:Hsp20/alpha crystallin family protein [Chloroflexota bacterium]